jgi:hypothetical protein
MYDGYTVLWHQFPIFIIIIIIIIIHVPLHLQQAEALQISNMSSSNLAIHIKQSSLNIHKLAYVWSKKPIHSN